MIESKPKSSVFGEAFHSELKQALREVIHEELRGNSNAIRCDDGGGLVNAEKAAEYLSVSTSWLYKNAHRLPFSKKIGGARRFDMHEMHRWLETHRR